MPKSSRRRYAIVKQEATYGTAETRAKTDSICCRNIDIQPIGGNALERPKMRPYLYTPTQSIPDKIVVITLELELSSSSKKGTPVVPPRWTPLLEACGMSQKSGNGNEGKYESILNRDNHKSCTIWVNVDRIEQQIAGCRGTFAINGTLGDYPTITFTMTGIYKTGASSTASPGSRPYEVATNAGISPTDAETDKDIAKVLRFGAKTSYIDMFGLAKASRSEMLCTALSLDCGNVVEVRGYVNSDSDSEIVILDRQPTGSVTYLMDQASAVAGKIVEYVETEATHGFEFIQQSTQSTQTVSGTPKENDAFSISSPKTAYDTPTYGDDSGDLLVTVPLRFQATGEAVTEQALSVEFKDFAKI